MSDRTPDPAALDAQESLRRLVDLLQVILPDRPKVIFAVERMVLALVVDEMRDRITARCKRMNPEQLATVEALTAHLVGEASDPPPDEVA